MEYSNNSQPNIQGSLSWAWGSTISWKEFKEHYVKCSLLSNDIKSVTQAVNQYIKDNKNIQKWRNLKTYFKWLLTYYIPGIISKKTGLSKQIWLHWEIEIQTESVKLLPWGHLIHHECLIQKYLEDSKQNKSWCCSIWSEDIPFSYLTNWFSSQEINEISNLLISYKKNKDFINWVNCGTYLDIEEGRPNFKEKDSEGNLVSEEAAKQKAKYRYKCVQCNTEACGYWKSSPYHSGFTCQQFAKL